MKLHPIAKTTPLTRQLLVTRVRHQGWSQRRAAEAAGVSVRTVAKWTTRHRAGDLALRDRSSRPHRMPRQTASGQVAAIIALRQTRATSWEISGRLQVPRSTVTRVLARAGLNRLALLEPRAVSQRYEWPHAGDLLHLDIKPLGRIRAIGHRFLGPSVHTRTRGAAGNMRMSRSMMRPGWPTWKSDGRRANRPASRFCGTRCSGSLDAASTCAGS